MSTEQPALAEHWIDRTHQESAQAIAAIRTWVAGAHERVANWTMRPMPEKPKQ